MVVEPGEVLAVAPARLRALVTHDTTLGDLILRAFPLRLPGVFAAGDVSQRLDQARVASAVGEGSIAIRIGARARRRPPARACRRPHSDVGLVEEAPAPVLAGLEGLDDRVADPMRMQACVATGRRIAAADVATAQAQAQVHPGRAEPETFLTTLGRPGRHPADLVAVGADHGRSHAR